jgi:ABC-2 type transport system ATP-binding protein
MKEEPLFKIKNISKYFGDKRVLGDVTFDIMPGEIIGIIGASGSGKTTLLNILVGFLNPDRGSLQFRFEHLLNFKDTEVYREINKKSFEIKKMIGFAAQIPSFYPNLTVEENMNYFGTLFNLSNDALKSNVEALLNLMELKESRSLLASKLSGGMQRRLDIACALIHDPKILILDEPTSDLDPILRKHIWELIKIIRSKGTTIILSSHHLTEIEHLCDRIAILQDGRFVEINTFNYIKDKYIKHKKVLIETRKKDYKLLLKDVSLKLIKNKEIIDNELVITSPNPTRLIEVLIRCSMKIKDEILNLSIDNPNLDEVFVSISSKDKLVETNENYDKHVEEEINQLSNISKSAAKNRKKQNKKNKLGKNAKKQSIFMYK